MTSRRRCHPSGFATPRSMWSSFCLFKWFRCALYNMLLLPRPLRYMEEVIESTFSLLSVHPDPGLAGPETPRALEPVYLLALLDIKATWFNKWMVCMLMSYQWRPCYWWLRSKHFPTSYLQHSYYSRAVIFRLLERKYKSLVSQIFHPYLMVIHDPVYRWEISWFFNPFINFNWFQIQNMLTVKVVWVNIKGQFTRAPPWYAHTHTHTAYRFEPHSWFALVALRENISIASQSQTVVKLQLEELQTVAPVAHQGCGPRGSALQPALVTVC